MSPPTKQNKSNQQEVGETSDISIRAVAKRNGITSMVIGAVGVLVGLLVLAVLPEWLFLTGIFITSGAIVALLIGWFKLREPEFSLQLSRQNIHYRHRLGQWQLDWSNVQRVDVPRVSRQLDLVDLEMVGIKIKDYEPFLSTISPRLATHLLMEQRPLLLQNNDKSCTTGTCYGNDFFDDNHYTLNSGKKVTGVIAMLANRMVQLRERLGYDVFLSASDLDREPIEFVTLLRQCHASLEQQSVAQKAEAQKT